MKHIYFVIIILLLRVDTSFAELQNKILINVGNQIITSYELKNKIQTVLFLNNQEVNQKNINDIKEEAINHLINIKLKKEEVLKYNAIAKDSSVAKYLKNIYSQNKTNASTFKLKFKENKLSYELYLEEIKTEFAWQQLILSFYRNKINLDEKTIDKELKQIIKKQSLVEEYNLAEIEILLESNTGDSKRINEMNDLINQIGFNDAAVKYSTSLSAFDGGKIGWINSKALSTQILNTVIEMKKGEVSKPIIQSGTATFIKLLDKRNINFNDINVNEMKKKIMRQKQNELLNLYANSYLSKIKNNTLIQYNE